MVLQNTRKLAKLKSSKEIEKSCHGLKINQFNKKKKKPNPMNSENSNAIKDYKSEIWEYYLFPRLIKSYNFFQY